MGLLTKKITDYLFIDIETASQYKTFDELVEKNSRLADLWLKKSNKFYKELEKEDIIDIDNKIYFDKAPLYPEFSKIISIGLGCFIEKGDNIEEYIKVLSNDNEITLLLELKNTMNKLKDKTLFGHNIVSFDLPFICKRFVYNGYIPIDSFNFVNKKPWEIDVVDTMNLFKFGGSYEVISMDLLSASLNVESPKNDMDGTMVNKVYHIDNNLNRITDYSKADIKAMMDSALFISNLK
jgi:hypothetical protein